MECDHISKVLEWGHKLVDGQLETSVALWGCTKCDVTSPTKFQEVEWVPLDHSNCNWDPCFGCKAKGLQLNTGDAGRADSMPQKKWDKELADYREARRQGIQPEGTSSKQIKSAIAASDTLGAAFNAETMGSADKITKSKAEGIKELGVV